MVSQVLKPREEVYKYYFYLIQERMNIFWKKYNKDEGSWTEDRIFQEYRFTNVFRSIDRISQYLIRNVIYSNLLFEKEDVIFRILIFKIFNKIETWELLEEKMGKISINNFDINKINKLLTEQRKKYPIFNNAYMMTGTHSLYNHYKFKHEKWLQMVNDEFIKGGVLSNIVKCNSLEEMYSILRECSFIGDFLAYQYAIDFNYSPIFNFDENTFVKAGIGAIRGIKKCFVDIQKKDYENAIYYTLHNFEKLQKRYGYFNFKNLYSRKPTLIDLQNCFCETDKYLRAKLPNFVIDNTKIKQKYIPNPMHYDLLFPPQWNIDMNQNYENH